MSIKPVDYNTIIPKTVDLSGSKHGENLKNRNIVEGGFIHQEKIIDRNKKRVLDVEKNLNPRIRDDSNSKGSSQSREGKKKKDKKPSKQGGSLRNRGSKIDIRI